MRLALVIAEAIVNLAIIIGAAHRCLVARDPPPRVVVLPASLAVSLLLAIATTVIG